MFVRQKTNRSGTISVVMVSKAMYRTCLEGVWLSDIGRMAEVRNVPHLALQGVSKEFVLIAKAME